MNYLAHLHLGGQRPEEMLGSLYGDFVKGRLHGQYSADIEHGIALHRSIDVFTDNHPLVDQSLSRFAHTRRRYAGIVLDVFFDHCLARDWGQYAEGPLERFTSDFTGCWWANNSCHGGLPRLRRTWRPMTGWVRIGILPAGAGVQWYSPALVAPRGTGRGDAGLEGVV